jgi:hypothetical protein
MRPIFLILSSLIIAGTAQARELKRVGWVEPISISDVGAVVQAKLDTGAKTSSIDANIIDIRKSGEKTKDSTGDTVVFAVTLDTGTIKTFERPVHRYVRIKKRGGGTLRRPVITMTFCIADRKVEEEVNLANREGFIYPVLVGRNMMADADLMIDPGVRRLSRPSCND